MERKYSIDLLRVISAVAVIIIHIISAPLKNSTVDIDMSLATNLNITHVLMNWSVPVFFMITGYCLLKKNDVSYKYCFLHILKYIGILLTVGLLYAVMEEVFTVKSMSISILKPLLNVISGNIWDHMWFVYEIIGIYLVMPVIHNFMQRGNRDIFILVILLFIFNIVFPAIEDYLPIGISVPFGGYLFYVCFGGAVAKVKINNNLYYLFAYITLILSTIYIVLFARDRQFGYKHLIVCVMAVSIFLIVSRMDIKPNKLLLCVSKCTFGIYLIHPFFINVAIKLFKIELLSSYACLKLFVFAVIIALISFLTTYMLRKTPLVNKLF